MRSAIGAVPHHTARPPVRLARRTHAVAAGKSGDKKSKGGASGVSTEILSLVADTDSGAGASPELRARVLELASTAEASYTDDARTSPLLVGDYRVSYTSSPQVSSRQLAKRRRTVAGAE